MRFRDYIYFFLPLFSDYSRDARGLSGLVFYVDINTSGFAARTGEKIASANHWFLSPGFEIFVEIQDRRNPYKPGVH